MKYYKVGQIFHYKDRTIDGDFKLLSLTNDSVKVEWINIKKYEYFSNIKSGYITIYSIFSLRSWEGLGILKLINIDLDLVCKKLLK